jgi:hypothetical protein
MKCQNILIPILVNIMEDSHAYYFLGKIASNRTFQEPEE